MVHLIRGVGGKSLSTLKWESGLRGGVYTSKGKRKIRIRNKNTGSVETKTRAKR